MSRPTDWYVLDLPRDPVPGDPGQVAVLARRVRGVAEDAERCERDARGLSGDSAVRAWIGLAAEVFRGALDDFPGQLAKLADSYGRAAAALGTYRTELDGAQDQADRALDHGRAAQADIDRLSGLLSSARAAACSAGSTVDRLAAPLPAGAEPPDPEQVRAATRNAQAASSRVTSLSTSLGGAHDRLEAAKRLARDAADLRDRAAGRAAADLHDASDAGITPNSWWEDFKGAAAKVWDVTIGIAKIAVVVLGVIALVVGGPLAWVVLGLGVLLLADALAKMARGEGSWWDVGFALLGCIPGVRGLTTLGALKNAFRAGGLLGATGHVLGAARTALVGMARTLRQGGGRVFDRLMPPRIPRTQVGSVGPGAVTADAAAAARLSPAQRAQVDDYLRRAAEAEGDITVRMEGIRDAIPGSRLSGLEFRLKGGDSLARKVADDLADNPFGSVSGTLDDINDAVRYTILADDADYTASATQALRRLQDEGFQMVKPPKNTWGSDGYQGINSTWRDPATGQTFEVQLHTPDSLAAKETTHPLYEQERVLPKGTPEQLALAERQRGIFNAVPRPPGASAVRQPGGSP